MFQEIGGKRGRPD